MRTGRPKTKNEIRGPDELCQPLLGPPRIHGKRGNPYAPAFHLLLLQRKPVALGSTVNLVRGDTFYWGELTGAAPIASVPVAIAYMLLSRSVYERHHCAAVK